MLPVIYVFFSLLLRRAFCFYVPWDAGYHVEPAVPRDVIINVINNLGLELLEAHNENNHNNIAISPYGAASVLIAISEGVLGIAQDEIKHSLHLPTDASVVRVGLRDVHRHLKSYFIPKEGFLAGLTLSHDNVTLKHDFEQILRFYGYDIDSFNNALYPDPYATITPSFESSTENTESPNTTQGDETTSIENVTIEQSTPTDRVTRETTEISTAKTNIASKISTNATPMSVKSTINVDMQEATSSIVDVTTTEYTTIASLSNIQIENATSSTTTKLPLSTTFEDLTQATPTSTKTKRTTEVVVDNRTAATRRTTLPPLTTETSTKLQETTSEFPSTMVTILETTATYSTVNTIETSTSNLQSAPSESDRVTMETSTLMSTTSEGDDYNPEEFSIDTRARIDVDVLELSARNISDMPEDNSNPTTTEKNYVTTIEAAAIITTEIFEKNPAESVTTSTEKYDETTLGAVATNTMENYNPGESVITSTEKIAENNLETAAINIMKNFEENVEELATSRFNENSLNISTTSIVNFEENLLVTPEVPFTTENIFENNAITENISESSTTVNLDDFYSTEYPATTQLYEARIADANTNNFNEVTTEFDQFSPYFTTSLDYGASTTTENAIQNYTIRNKRSVVDYIIARYYDDYYGGDNYDHHKVDGANNYEPEGHFSFLVNGRNRESNINFMTYDTVLPFSYVPNLNALALGFPLDNIKYYLLLLLPVEETGIDRLISDLNKAKNLGEIIGNLKHTRVKASIPSFMLKGYVVLTPTLQKLGVRKIFEPRQADFSPMTGDEDTYVTNIEQAITVTIRNYVDPKSLMDNYSNLHQYGPVQFKADHPFLYFVIDAEVHVALMAGKMVNPLNSRIR